MATVAAVIASTHHPFYYRASTSAGPDRPPFADEWVAKIEAFRQTLTRAEPDVLVMVGSDHFHQLWLDNMPQFLVGKAPFFDANWYNEEREFGLPRMRLAGDEDLAAYLLREGLDAGFDLAFSNELRIDHSVTCPIITLRPQADLPIVPVYTNIFAPPMPRPSRFVELGRALRRMVEAWPSDKRVAIIGTGHLSLELGGPRQFGPHGPDPEFDRKAVAWIQRRRRRLPGRGHAGQPARPRQRHPRVHGFHADDGRGRRRSEGRLHRQPGPVPHHGGVLHLVPVGSVIMSKYLLDKFLYTVDRDPELVERYRSDPGGTVQWWEREMANTVLNCHAAEKSTWLAFGEEERRALREHDYVALFGMGAHPFLTLTLFIAMFERDHGPLEYQIAYARAMDHITLPYPDIAT